MNSRFTTTAALAAGIFLTAGWLPGGTAGAAPADAATKPAVETAPSVTLVADTYRSTRRRVRTSAMNGVNRTRVVYRNVYRDRTVYRSPRVVYRNVYRTPRTVYYGAGYGNGFYGNGFGIGTGLGIGTVGTGFGIGAGFGVSPFTAGGPYLTGSGFFGYYGTSQCYLNCRTAYGPFFCRRHCGWQW